MLPKKSNKKTSIPYWSNDDQPREKLLLKGVGQLTDAELLAIILRMGTRDKSAVELARDMLAKHNNNIANFAELEIAQLTAFSGVGEAKAVAIKAAFELGRRSHLEDVDENPIVNSSHLAHQIVSRDLGIQPHEECWLLLLNRSNRLLSKTCVSTGGITATVVDVRIILKKAVEKLASGIILCHNHPSGNLKPSIADKKITQKLQEAAALMDIKLIDHLIVTKSGYYSFADEGDLV